MNATGQGDRFDGTVPQRKWLGAVVDAAIARIWLAVVLLLGGGFAIVWVSFAPSVASWSEPIVYALRQVGTAMLVTGVATGLIRIFILRYYQRFEDEFVGFVRKDVTNGLERINDSIDNQAQQFVESVSSLEAMRLSNVSRVYSSRLKASGDISRDLTDPSVDQIRIIGISLNDFVRGDQPALHKAWQHLEGLIKRTEPAPEQVGGLDIKVLIIDPYCHGAQLRSKGESQKPTAIAGRLEGEVVDTTNHLIKLQKHARAFQDRTGISFEFRLYRLPPTLFLCRTNEVSYVQAYHFWAARHREVPTPVLRYNDKPGAQPAETLHEQMEAHFDWIWDQASVPAEEFLEAGAVGIDRGLHEAAVVNVFNDPSAARDRILRLLTCAKRRVYVQGISLHSFFSRGSLFAAILKLVERQDVEIKCLILDPESIQAKYRAFREQLFVDSAMTFAAFQSNVALYENSALFRDTQNTMENIRLGLAPNAGPLFEVRLYDSAPTCFILLVDDTVVVEQYHYGKIHTGAGRFPAILGKEMPVIEYGLEPSTLFPGDPMRRPLKLLEDHFEFAFRSAKAVSFPAAKPPAAPAS